MYVRDLDGLAAGMAPMNVVRRPPTSIQVPIKSLPPVASAVVTSGRMIDFYDPRRAMTPSERERRRSLERKRSRELEAETVKAEHEEALRELRERRAAAAEDRTDAEPAEATATPPSSRAAPPAEDAGKLLLPAAIVGALMLFGG